MNNDIRDEGQQANMRGMLRSANPYNMSHGKRFAWDCGWLVQTQAWAKRPKGMCVGRNCTALKGMGHSEECEADHDATVKGLMLNFET